MFPTQREPIGTERALQQTPRGVLLIVGHLFEVHALADVDAVIHVGPPTPLGSFDRKDCSNLLFFRQGRQKARRVFADPIRRHAARTNRKQTLLDTRRRRDAAKRLGYGRDLVLGKAPLGRKQPFVIGGLGDSQRREKSAAENARDQEYSSCHRASLIHHRPDAFGMALLWRLS